MKILLADDHDLVRESIASFLEASGEMSVAMAPDLAGALESIDRENEFDLIVLDYGMPDMNGLDGLQKAMAASGGKPVALISGTAARDVAEAALAMGAAGFIPKTLGMKTLMNALQFMAAGEQYAPVQWMTAVEEQPTNALADRLSERELQVLKGLCKGDSNKEIARDLDLQEVTVKLHVKTLCRKLGARNRTHAAMIARDEGAY